MAGMEFKVDERYLRGLVSIIRQPIPLKKDGTPKKRGFEDLMNDKVEARRQLTDFINANQITARGLRSILRGK